MDLAFRNAVAKARQQDGLYFAAFLPENLILDAFGKARELWQGWVYTPAVTVWVFLAQCLSADHSCRDAVANLIAWRLASGLRPCSAKTGAYCTARDDVPEETCSRLMRETGRQVADAAPADWRWLGHRVLNVDGSTITMADTPANQAEYPQLKGQAAGCGFPIARILTVFCLATGVVLDAAIGKYHGKKTGENSLFRTLHDLLQAGDVTLSDRYFGGWFDIALQRQHGAHAVVRKHQKRPTDFRTGQRLGFDDHLVRWVKPKRPQWMSKEVYESLPDELVLRELRVRVTQKGFRSREVLVITTLLDAELYTAAKIADLYRRRWQAELNLRSLKSVMQMDQLRCKTPHRVRNEFFMHLVAYNLLRGVMAQAAAKKGVEPCQVSFKGTLQTMHALLPLLATKIATDDWCDELLKAVASHAVGNRPDRIEPRLIKRRPKKYNRLKHPRAHYKKQAA